MARVVAFGMSWRKNIPAVFAPQCTGDKAHACDVAARPIQTGDKTVLDWIASGHEQNRHRRVWFLRSRRRKHIGDDDIHRPANQFRPPATEADQSDCRLVPMSRTLLASSISSALCSVEKRKSENKRRDLSFQMLRCAPALGDCFRRIFPAMQGQPLEKHSGKPL